MATSMIQAKAVLIVADMSNSPAAPAPPSGGGSIFTTIIQIILQVLGGLGACGITGAAAHQALTHPNAFQQRSFWRAVKANLGRHQSVLWGSTYNSTINVASTLTPEESAAMMKEANG